MKRSPVLSLTAVTLVSSAACLGQSFQNLDFEMADVTGVPLPSGGPGELPPSLPTSKGLPYWQASLRNPNATFSDIFYCDFYMETSGLAIYDTNVVYGYTTYQLSDAPLPLQGDFSLFFQADGSIEDYWGDPTITQTGTIPGDSKSIWFEASSSLRGAWDTGDPVWKGWQMIMEVDGNPVPFAWQADVDSKVSQYAADISAYAGQTVALSFTLHTDTPVFEGEPPPGVPIPAIRTAVLDDIRFLTIFVPELSVVTLLGLGSLVLLRLKLRAWR